MIGTCLCAPAVAVLVRTRAVWFLLCFFLADLVFELLCVLGFRFVVCEGSQCKRSGGIKFSSPIHDVQLTVFVRCRLAEVDVHDSRFFTSFRRRLVRHRLGLRLGVRAVRGRRQPCGKTTRPLGMRTRQEENNAPSSLCRCMYSRTGFDSNRANVVSCTQTSMEVTVRANATYIALRSSFPHSGAADVLLDRVVSQNEGALV